MTDEVVSLFALMDAHLSKTALNEGSSDNDENNSTNASHNPLSATQRPKLAIPQFFPGNSPMKDFLAEKISMLKAKAKQKEEEEQRKIVEEMRMLDINENPKFNEEETKNTKINNEPEYLIDLTSAIIRQPKPGQVPDKLPNHNQTYKRVPFTSEVDQTPSQSVSSFSMMDFRPYTSSMSETSLTNEDSLPSQTSEDYLEENSTWNMPKVDWNNMNDYEPAPMTPEEEHRLKMKQQETLWVEEELRKMRIRHEQEFPLLHLLDEEVIPQPKPTRPRPQPIIKNKGSKRLIYDKETCLYKEWDPNLPCTTDISHILENDTNRAKCSPFGKVLCARERPLNRMSIPYARKKRMHSNIVRFDFKTKSPDDIYRENQTSLNKNQPKSKIPLRMLLNLMECI